MRAIAHLTAITATASLLTLTAPPATTAQLIPDTTLGSENSQVTPGALIHGLPADLIEGGAPRGSNLFHSFQEFNVGDLQRVYFDNPAGITNIFSRVTGGNPSQILGTLGVAGSANLFFLNPNGLLFGPKAQLDIAGSFFASTADRWLFDNGLEFSATNPAAPSPLLTISITPGLQSGTAHHAGISSQGNLVTGGDLTLHGGWLDLQGTLQAGGALTLHATDTLRLRDTATIPFIAAARGNLLVQGNNQVDIFTLNHPDSGFYAGGDLVLRSSNAVGGDAHFWSGGNFRVEQLDGSSGDLFSPHDPIIRSYGDVMLGNYEGASLHILAAGRVSAGRIRIVGPDGTGNAINPVDFPDLATVTLSNGATQVIDGTAVATLDIRAGMNISLIGFPVGRVGPVIDISGLALPTPATDGTINVAEIYNDFADGLILLTNNFDPNPSLAAADINLLSGGKITGNNSQIIIDARGDFNLRAPMLSESVTGDSGSIHLMSTTGNISIADNLSTSNSGSGSAGDITIRAFNGTVKIEEEAKISARSDTSSGNIRLTTNNGNVEIRGDILADTLGAGNAGEITANTLNGNVILGEGAILSARSDASSGNIRLTTNNGNVEIRGGILADTLGAGNAGEIIANTLNGNVILGEGAILSARTQSTGNAGVISLIAPNGNVEISGNALVDTAGLGRAGQVNVFAPNGVVSLRNRAELSARSQASSGGGGNAGAITVNTRYLNLNDGAGLYANTNTAGHAGRINLNIAEKVNLNQGFIFVNTFGGTGDAGQVSIQARQMNAVNGSLISAFSQGSGQGGNININAFDSLELVGNNGASTGIFLGATSTGNAGNLNITTNRLTLREGASIFASTSGVGQAGEVRITAHEALSITGTSPNGQIRSGLSADTFGGGNAGNFTISTARLSVSNGGEISASTTSSGQAGQLQINAKERLEVIGTSAMGAESRIIFESSGFGQAGGIQINTGELLVRDRGQITVSGSGSGVSGDLEINARSIDLINQGRLRAVTEASQGGNIILRVAESINLRYNSEITAEAFGFSNGGNMWLDVGGFIVAVLSENSDVVASAVGGRGGFIFVRAAGILGFRNFQGRRTSESDFTASSEFGIDGALLALTNSLQLTEIQLIDPSETQVVVDCQSHSIANGSPEGGNRLYLWGQGGFAANPEEPGANSVSVPWLDLDEFSDNAIVTSQNYSEHLPSDTVINYFSCALR